MNHKAMKRFAVIFLTVLGLLIAAGLIYRVRQNENLGVETDPSYLSVVGNQLKPEAEPVTEAVEIKSSVLLAIPFTPQAPTANWDELHNEACEEAGVLMAAQYFSGNYAEKLDAAFVEKEFEKITTWEQDNFGFHLDTTSEETAKFAEKIYGLKTQIIKDFSEEDIKKALSRGKLVIISEAGRRLNNPNYKQPGPLHHMLLIKGYDAKGLITNDSGTRKGKDYRYTFKTIFEAAADWDHTINSVDTSKKIAIVVWK